MKNSRHVIIGFIAVAPALAAEHFCLGGGREIVTTTQPTLHVEFYEVPATQTTQPEVVIMSFGEPRLSTTQKTKCGSTTQPSQPKIEQSH